MSKENPTRAETIINIENASRRKKNASRRRLSVAGLLDRLRERRVRNTLPFFVIVLLVLSGCLNQSATTSDSLVISPAVTTGSEDPSVTADTGNPSCCDVIQPVVPPVESNCGDIGAITVTQAYQGAKERGLIYYHPSIGEVYAERPGGYIYPIKREDRTGLLFAGLNFLADCGGLTVAQLGDPLPYLESLKACERSAVVGKESIVSTGQLELAVLLLKAEMMRQCPHSTIETMIPFDLSPHWSLYSLGEGEPQYPVYTGPNGDKLIRLATYGHVPVELIACDRTALNNVGQQLADLREALPGLTGCRNQSGSQKGAYFEPFIPVVPVGGFPDLRGVWSACVKGGEDGKPVVAIVVLPGPVEAVRKGESSVVSRQREFLVKRYPPFWLNHPDIFIALTSEAYPEITRGPLVYNGINDFLDGPFFWLKSVPDAFKELPAPTSDCVITYPGRP